MYLSLQHLAQKIKSIVKRAYVSKTNADNSDYPLTQITYFGDKTADAERISPYGLYCNLPEDTAVLLFSVNSHQENKAIIGYAQKNRFKNLLPGEVVVGNIITNTFIKFDNEGNIEIQGQADININTTGKINLGTGGKQIARVDDLVSVNPATGDGTIISGGLNTSV